MGRLVLVLWLSAAASLARPDCAFAQAQGDALSQALESRDRVIQQLLERVEALEREIRALREEAQIKPAPEVPVAPPAAAPVTPPALPAPAPPPAAAGVAEAPPAPAQPEAPSPPTAAAPTEPTPPAEEEREVTRVPQVAVERGGSLLRPGNFQIETNFSYSHSESSRLIVGGFTVLPLIILGTLGSERVKTDVLSPTFAFRYGIIKDLQADVRVPLIYQTTSRVRLSNEVASLVQESEQQFGFGDVEFGLTYQPLYEKGWLPDLVVSLRARAPTGRDQFSIFKDISQQGPFTSVEDFTRRLNAEGLPLGSGFWGVSGSVSATKAFDPVILFGTVGYRFNLERNVTNIQIIGTPSGGGVSLVPQAIQQNIQPGDSVFFSLGAAVALTGQVSVNFSFTDQITFNSKQEGQKIAGSSTNIGQFNAGFTLGISRTVSLDFSGSIGATPDAPSFGLGVSVIKGFASIKELWPFGN